MRSLVRIGLLVLQLVAFFLVTALCAQALSYLTALTYVPSATPNGQFPVVAVLRNEPTSTKVQYQLLRWWEIRKTPLSASPPSFKLPELQGQFALPNEGDYEPSVEFKVIETTGNRQLVEVTWRDEDYVFYSKYSTDGTTVWPAYLRIWGASSMMIALIPGLILTWLFGRITAWLWKKRSNAQVPISG